MSSDNQFNFYNTDIAQSRLNELKNKTIKHCIKHNVTKLNICLLGDLISGCIKTGIRVQQEEDVISQITLVSEILAQMVAAIQEKLKIEIYVYSVYGNHSRVIPNKTDAIGQENFERLIPYIMRLRLNGKIKVIDSLNDDFLMANIAGKRVYLTHGHNDSPSKAQDNCVRLLGEVPDEIYMGHFHHTSTKDDCDCDVVCNGSLCGSDDYVISLRKVTKPSQVLRIYEDDIVQYKIELE